MEQGGRHPLTFGVVTGQHQLTWPQLSRSGKWPRSSGSTPSSCSIISWPSTRDPDGPCLEASTLLAALALKTSRIKIGVLVYGNTHRHPAVFAKEMTTVDHVSDGRVIIGIGTGWNEREHAAYSIPFPSAAIASRCSTNRSRSSGRFSPSAAQRLTGSITNCRTHRSRRNRSSQPSRSWSAGTGRGC